MGENPKIILPQNESVKKALEKKLEEYKERTKKIEGEEPYMHPGLIMRTNQNYTDSLYKIAITEKLLKEGIVDTRNLSIELNKLHDFFHTHRINAQ